MAAYGHTVLYCANHARTANQKCSSHTLMPIYQILQERVKVSPHVIAWGLQVLEQTSLLAIYLLRINYTHFEEMNARMMALKATALQTLKSVMCWPGIKKFARQLCVSFFKLNTFLSAPTHYDSPKSMLSTSNFVVLKSLSESWLHPLIKTGMISFSFVLCFQALLLKDPWHHIWKLEMLVLLDSLAFGATSDRLLVESIALKIL